MEQTYELFYGTGGHGGPYPYLNDAIQTGINHLKGSRTERTIYIRPRTADGIGGYGTTVVTISKTQEFEFNGGVMMFNPPSANPGTHCSCGEGNTPGLAHCEGCPLKDKPEPMNVDWFVSAVRVELKHLCADLRLEIESANEQCPATSPKALLLEAKMHGIMIAESRMIEVMRTKT